MATPSNSKPTAAWKRYQLNVKNVYACAFTPDSHQVALYYWTSRLLSDKPWKAVYTSHVSVWSFETGKIEDKFKSQYTDTGSHDPWATDPRYMQFTADGRRLVLFNSNEIDVFDVPSYKLQSQIPVNRPSENLADGDMWGIVGNANYFGPGFALASDGSRVAVAFSDSADAEGGFVRVYELPSGRVVREWRLGGKVKVIAGIALSPDGQRVAVSWQPSAGSSDPEAFIPSGNR
jgi:DNA-binding beta-propeller fold protein YncE